METTKALYTKENLKSLDAKELEKVLEQARDLYYNTGEVIMDDATYDYGIELTGKDNPIGVKPRQDTRFPVLKHRIPMCSLNKAKNLSEVKGWIQAMKIDSAWLICEKKYDGLSLAVTYNKEGQLEHAILRGDGFEGEDVLQNAKKFLPETCTALVGTEFILRGEVVISKENFEKLPKDEYKNRRNCVSGIIRRLDGKHCELLDLICYDMIIPSLPEALKSEVIKLGTIQQLNCFKVAKVWFYSEQIFEDLAKERDGEYMIDGIVIKHNDSIKNMQVGVGANGNPLLQLAYKFPAEEGITYVSDVKWEINANKLTPVALVEPIAIQGSTISRVSLAGLNQFKKLNLHKNSKIHIKKANDVIPVIDKKVAIQDREGEIFTTPAFCEACGAPIVENEKGTQLYCSNKNCKGKLIYILANDLKSILKTKGFGKALIEQLVNSEKIKTIIGLFQLSPEDIANGSNMNLSRCKKFYETLHIALKNCTVDKLFLLFGIEGIGEKKLKEIQNFELKTVLAYSELECQSKFGKAAGSKFFNFKEEHFEEIKILENIKTRM